MSKKKDTNMMKYSEVLDNPQVEKVRKKWKRKRDLRAIKAKMNPFEKIQVDVKYLDDMPEFYPFLIRHRLPRYEHTARDVMTGFTFICLGYEFSPKLRNPNGQRRFSRRGLGELLQ